MRKDDGGHIRGIVDGLLRRWERHAVKKGRAVTEAWEKATGGAAKGHALPVSLKKGTLMVITENSSWLYKLTIEKKEILEKFNREYKGRKKASDMRFRVGELESR